MSTSERYPLNETLTDAYERIRRLAGEPSSCHERGIGVGLIMQRGMFTWIHTIATGMPVERPLSDRAQQPARPLAPAAERELVNTIASIITGASSASRSFTSSIL